MSIGFITISVRNRRTGNYHPAILAVKDIQQILSLESCHIPADEKDLIGKSVIYTSESVPGEPLDLPEEIMRMFGIPSKASHQLVTKSVSMTVAESVETLYRKLSNAALGIADDPLLMARFIPAKTVKQEGCEKGPDPIITDAGGEPETQKPV